MVASLGLLASQGAGVALAHGETSPLIQTVVEGVDPALPGISARNAPGIPTQLTIVNRNPTDVQVLGMNGRPFLRIGAKGVFADIHSVAWYRSGNPDSVVSRPRGVRLGGPPQWVRVSTRPAWSFFDFRLRPGKTPVPPAAREGRRPVVLDHFAVPLRYGGRVLNVRGRVEFQPLVGVVYPTLASPPALAPGVSTQILNGPLPGLYLDNRGPRPVTVLGRDGEPFARIGPKGVDVNRHSTTYADGVRAGGDLPTVRVDPAAPPRWQHLADEPRYGWIDSRLRYARAQPPGDVVRRPRPTVLMNWSVPVETSGGRVEVRGRTSWVPVAVPAAKEADHRESGALPTWLTIAGAVVGVAALLALALRRRAATAPATGRAERVG